MAASDAAEDRELLKEVANHDRASFELLYRRYYPRVVEFVKRMVRETELAEEVVDDAMFALWRSAESFEGRSTVSTWIFGIAYRQALKALDRAGRRKETGVEPQFIEAVVDTDSRNDPSQAAANSQLKVLLSNGVASLSVDHQSVLELAALGCSAAEISEMTNCPQATVRTRLFHARKQLKQFLADSDESIAHTRTGTRNE